MAYQLILLRYKEQARSFEKTDHTPGFEGRVQL